MRALLVSGALVLLTWVSGEYYLRSVAPRPPAIPSDVDMGTPAGRALRENGVWWMWLSGPPEVRGASTTRLVAPVMAAIDRSMHATFSEIVPSRLARTAMLGFGRYYARWLSEDVPLELQRELHGQMLAYDDPFGDGGGKYVRFLSYLALHDLAQTIEHSPLVACSAFAVTGAASGTGGTLLGRNFDFEGGRVFDEHKSVTVFSDGGRFKVASIAWPGMPGVVSGLNAARVWISINAARSDHESPRGTPVALLIREVLEQAASADAAVELLRAAQVRVADLYLVADAHGAVVVEKTPATSVVRRAAPSLVVTNHFLDVTLAGEARNQQLLRRTTSLPRYQRLEQLVATRAPIDAASAQEILRDRTLADGTRLAVGDRRALDGFLATHGVVVDLANDTLYVSQAPHLSGAWHGVKLEALFAGRLEWVEALPPDDVALHQGADIGYRVPGK